MHHLWARAHLTVLEIRFFGAVVVASIILFRLVITVAKIRFSEQKTKIFLSFFEREYLRAVFTAQSYDKFPNPPRLGGEISVCLGMLDIKKAPPPVPGQ